MGFHSPVFLVGFLPACLLIALLAGRRYHKWVLLAASVVFYAWADWRYLPLTAGLIVITFILAQFVQRQRTADDDKSAAAQAHRRQARWALLAAVSLNLGALVFFKLLVGYGADWLPFVRPESEGWPAYGLLPLGLSYISFQLISYIVDVHNEIIDSETNFWKFAAYALLFPKVVVGPITRYRDMEKELENPSTSPAQIAEGARRFILGLGKKVLIADTLARLVDPAFALSAPQFSTGMAWLVVIAFAVQLYFDFSGYVDMAIGLGQMLGLRLPENFNYPYVSRSIGEFWRRWHITLSAWFRDYVFYPLEFTRRREDRLRQQLHALVIFLLTGLWHGLTINFALWGLIHGAAVAVESRGFARKLKKAPVPVQHIYTLLIVTLGWVFFRSPTPAYALSLLARMVGLPGASGIDPAERMTFAAVDPWVWAALLAGIIFSLPVIPAFRKRWWSGAAEQLRPARTWRIAADFALFLLLLASFAVLAQYAFIPAIYSGF